MGADSSYSVNLRSQRKLLCENGGQSAAKEPEFMYRDKRAFIKKKALELMSPPVDAGRLFFDLSFKATD